MYFIKILHLQKSFSTSSLEANIHVVYEIEIIL